LKSREITKILKNILLNKNKVTNMNQYFKIDKVLENGLKLTEAEYNSASKQLVVCYTDTSGKVSSLMKDVGESVGSVMQAIVDELKSKKVCKCGDVMDCDECFCCVIKGVVDGL
jgi:predicted oxidoreductase (fatty acid repression mutant protein)